MALLLHIETSDKLCSAALSDNDRLIALKSGQGERAHASMLTVIINELIKENGISSESLDAVSVSMGPGSYTGLRIGVSAAKGMCYALGKPLIAVNTLLAMASGMIEAVAGMDDKILLCPMIDARRMEVYNAVYNSGLNEVVSTRATIVDETTFSELLKSSKIIFAGSGAEKCKSVIGTANAIYLDNFNCQASFLVPLASRMFDEKKFVDTAYFEPYYLKDFIATTASKKVL